MFLPERHRVTRRLQRHGLYRQNPEYGSWMQAGQTFGSPSAAAHAITQSGINGWWFWSVKRPGDPAWMQLGKLRSA